VSDHPQYPSYPGDDDLTPPAGPGREPPVYGQQPPSAGSGQAPPPGYGQAPPPGYGQAPPPGYGQAPGFGYPQQPHVPTSTKAVLGLVFGILSILFCYLGVLIGPAAIVVSVLARKEIDARPGAWTGKGMATAGLVTGIIGTIIWGSVDVLVALAVANDW